MEAERDVAAPTGHEGRPRRGSPVPRGCPGRRMLHRATLPGVRHNAVCPLAQTGRAIWILPVHAVSRSVLAGLEAPENIRRTALHEPGGSVPRIEDPRCPHRHGRFSSPHRAPTGPRCPSALRGRRPQPAARGYLGRAGGTAGSRFPNKGNVVWTCRRNARAISLRVPFLRYTRST